jgi:hypothetical protein
MMRTILLLAGLVFCVPGLAFADSDYYYCAARGYLAYETRLGTKPLKHELHIVRFSSRGIVAAAPIALDEFQVHGMSCRDGAVEILGWERSYSIDISNAMRPAVTSRAAAFDAEKSRAADNLGHLAKPGVLDLEADGPSRFQLVVARVSHSPRAGGIEHHTVTRLVRRASNRPGSGIVSARQLFAGVFLETIN